jgi:5-methylthioribose kinase
LPFTENTFNLDQIQPGLQQLANQCKLDRQLTNQVDQLGKCYLGNGNSLLHGDFYPGSMLRSGKDLKVIDPEFSFMGPEEWDIAVFTAHLFLAQTTLEVIQATLKLYKPGDKFDRHKFAGFTGTEILRRLIGLAQVPVALSLDQKNRLIQEAIGWIKTGKTGMKWG